MSKRFLTSVTGPLGVSLFTVENTVKHSQATFVEDERPAAERYWNLLERYPDMGKRRLYERFDDYYVRAYASKDRAFIDDVRDLLELRWHVFETMLLNHVGLIHTSQYEMEHTHLQLAKLAEHSAACAVRQTAMHLQIN